MRRRVALVLALAVLVALTVAGGTTLSTGHHAADAGPIYPEYQVVAGLARQPTRWVGRTIRVRGIGLGLICTIGVCRGGPPRPDDLLRGDWLPLLNDVSIMDGAAPGPLPMRLEPRNPLVAFLSRTPGVGSALAGRSVDWDTPAVYPLRIQARPCLVGRTYCYEGVLADAVPTLP